MCFSPLGASIAIFTLSKLAEVMQPYTRGKPALTDFTSRPSWYSCHYCVIGLHCVDCVTVGFRSFTTIR